eukprot:6046670-Pyramimonas_sp.AAC.1
MNSGPGERCEIRPVSSVHMSNTTKASEGEGGGPAHCSGPLGMHERDSQEVASQFCPTPRSLLVAPEQRGAE